MSIDAKNKINEKVQASIQPEIEITRDDENNTIKIGVTHIRGITKLAYQWNDDEETVIDGKNQKSINTEIDLIGGENTLKIAVTEEKSIPDKVGLTTGAGPEVELKVFGNREDVNFIRVDASERFLGKLAGVTDPETKRKIIGEEFIRVFDSSKNENLKGCTFLGKYGKYHHYKDEDGRY